MVEEHGFAPLVAETAESSARLESMLHHFLSRRVEAIVTTAVHARDAALVASVREAGVPIVLAVRGLPGSDFPAVLHDDVIGGSLAASHLVDLGHRVVAHVQGPPDIDTFARRRQGFDSRLADSDVEALVLNEVPVASTLEEGRRLTERILSSDGPPPTALFAANDMMAVGALEALTGHGLSCPRDVSIVGYDDMPLIGHVTPPMTTIRLPSDDLGRSAGRMALLLIEQPELRPETVQLPATLILRESTAPPMGRERGGGAKRRSRTGASEGRMGGGSRTSKPSA